MTKEIRRIVQLCSRFKVNPFRLLVPVGLSFVVVLLEGTGTALLLPLFRGLLSRNFDFISQNPAWKKLSAALPVPAHSDVAIFFTIVGFIFLTAILQKAFAYIAQLSTLRYVRDLTQRVRLSILERTFTFGKLFFDRMNQGFLMTRLYSYADQIGQQIMTLKDMVQWALLTVLYLGLMFYISWKFSLLVFLLFPLLSLSTRWLVEKIRKTSEHQFRSKKRMSELAFNILSCVFLVRASNREWAELDRFQRVSREVIEWDISMQKKNMVLGPLQEIVTLFFLLLMMSLLALYVLSPSYAGDVTKFLVFFYVTRKLTAQAGGWTRFRAGFGRQEATLEDLMQLFDDKDKFIVPDGAVEFDGLKREIEFKNLVFSYDPRVPVLKGVSFQADKGQMVAVVGSTGSGKTTLANLLLRFYDCPPGQILIDGTDIRALRIASLRARMAVVSQETWLFNDTLGFNVTYGIRREVTQEELRMALERSRLTDLVHRLPRGLETLIGDRGTKLSGGERQRVSIARALLKNPEILILDEATSALDSRTEKMIQEALDELLKDRTSIVIAHRLSTIKHADRIVVLEEGRIVEQGSLDELLAKKGRFFLYWEEQKFS